MTSTQNPYRLNCSAASCRDIKNERVSVIASEEERSVIVRPVTNYTEQLAVAVAVKHMPRDQGVVGSNRAGC